MSSVDAAGVAGAPRWNTVFDRLVFFTWWIRWEEGFERVSVRVRYSIFSVVALVAVWARLWAQSLPGNWDFGQWLNVSNAALSGQDPYSLFGYNYPPPWLVTLTALNAVTSSTESFRLMIAILLIAADLGIAFLLARRGYGLAACLFLLSPITVAISGQHQQVEGIAVFLSLAAVTVLGGKRRLGNSPDTVTSADWWMALLLGLSLSFKPVFLILPLWLAMRPGSVWPRLFRLMAPLAVFAVIFSSSFLVYSPQVVVQKVLEHSGANNSPLINALVPQQVAPWVLEHGGGKVAFVALLVAAGWIFRRLAPFELALAYSLSAVVFSWAMVNQYLAGPMAAVAVYMNAGLLMWFLLSSIYLGGSADVLNIPGLNVLQPHVLLDWERVMQDLFPWMLLGWIVFAFAMRMPGRIYKPDLLQVDVRR